MGAATLTRMAARDDLLPRRRAGDQLGANASVRPTVARVDATAIADNVHAIRRAVGSSVRILGVVKADGYGHGAVRTARAALEAGA